jgi:hypothetical protein
MAARVEELRVGGCDPLGEFGILVSGKPLVKILNIRIPLNAHVALRDT